MSFGPTYEAEIGCVELWLCDLCLDATHDGGLAHAYEGGPVGGGDGACGDERTDGRRVGHAPTFTETSRHARGARASGLTPSARKRSR